MMGGGIRTVPDGLGLDWFEVAGEKSGLKALTLMPQPETASFPPDKGGSVPKPETLNPNPKP